MKPHTLLLLIGLSVAALGGPPNWDTFRFQSDADSKHLKALLKALPPLTTGFTHHPFRVGGNFIGEGWTKGMNNVVLNDDFMNAPGSAWYQIQALHYKAPDAFACMLSAGRNPAKDGVGIRFWYCSGGRTVVGDGVDLDMAIWKKGKVESKIPILRAPLDLPQPFEVVDEVPPKTDWKADLAALTDAEKFRSTTVKRYDQAAARFRRALAEGRVKRRKFLGYQNDGIPPESNLVLITDDEAIELKRFVETKVSGWKKLMEEHGDAMYSEFHEVIPLQAMLDEPAPAESTPTPAEPSPGDALR